MAGLILIVLVLPLTVSSQDDPCNSYRMLSDDGGRSINCSLYYSESHDRFIAEGWRRVQLESTGEDLTMPTECVPHGFCGSHSNVWLNGTHPTVEDGIVDRMGCLSMFSSCCKVEYPIQIKNCTDYMVYNLMRTFGSDERYCFGDSTYCYQTSRPTTVSSTTKKYESLSTAIVDNDANHEKSSPTDPYNHPGNQRPTNGHGKHGFVQDLRHYKTDELVLILGVCLSVTIALLIILVFGIFLYLRQRKIGPKYDMNTKPTKA
ncbi:hypothetical protein LOTGIDRAFT_237275 [Lottia gigantea]|uniref:UMOD/GP2/OIT3-like D8C domain-containing protein n=1 Tax=Lottia gigantea TaxID=225164 RepID=V4CQK3_LOTGI|nr:hypothetical protein LOTGIDRAFT_237275 [Lottia gigantea]ESP04745.1 hypothetical protein LOTGIDRAFT_237275 [Lottia gigantea]